MEKERKREKRGTFTVASDHLLVEPLAPREPAFLSKCLEMSCVYYIASKLEMSDKSLSLNP